MSLNSSFNSRYRPAEKSQWAGRKETASENAYWYQTVRFADLRSGILNESQNENPGTVVMGYACDEGVERNQGRTGAIQGSESVRKLLGSLPNHKQAIFDAGDIFCDDGDMESTQQALADAVELILKANRFPILIGGGHDISYGHYTGIRSYLDQTSPDATIGMINLDAHFDLRSNAKGNNSGTPFYQIAQDCKSSDIPFKYLCLGIQESSNTTQLFETAKELGVQYVLAQDFHIQNATSVVSNIETFINSVDHVYLTIDLDGFSSAYAPGVSAPSPMGFAPDIAVLTIEKIKASGKLISADLAELNPTYDIDQHTARLASKLIHLLSKK